MLENHKHNIFSLLISAKPAWYFKAIIVSVLAFYFIKNSNFRIKKRFYLVVLLSILFIYLPHLPLALSQKYSTNYYASNYVTTYFSYISICLLLGFIFSVSNQISKSIIRKAANIFIVIILAMGSLMCDYSNWHSAKDLQIPLNTFNCIDEFIETETFMSIPEEAFIYAPNLFNNSSKLSWAYLHIWSDYVKAKTGKKVIFSNDKIEFVKKNNNEEKPTYYLNFGSDRKSVDRYIGFARISNNQLFDSVDSKIYSDSLTLYYYSTYKDFAFNFAVENKIDSLKTININDSTIQITNSHVNLRCRYKNHNEYFKPIHIISKNIDVQSVTVSNKLTRNEVDIEL